MAFETTAFTGAKPRATSTGKVTRVPEPTMVLMVPAHRPAKKMTISRQNSTAAPVS
ncbi:hypothetical protein D9M73_260570 [compost metagenome]